MQAKGAATLISSVQQVLGHRLRKRIKQLIADRSGLARKQRREMLKTLLSREKEEWRVAAAQAHEKSMHETGIFSFAGDPRSVLMWSHYGDQHTGICLQFAIARDPKTFLEAVPVRYVDSYPVFNWAQDSGSQMRDSLLHKYEAWRYEGEWRIIWPGGSRSYLPFDPSALVGLIYGCRCDAATIGIVQDMLTERAALGHPPVKEYRVEKHDDRYALRIRAWR